MGWPGKQEAKQIRHGKRKQSFQDGDIFLSCSSSSVAKENYRATGPNWSEQGTPKGKEQQPTHTHNKLWKKAFATLMDRRYLWVKFSILLYSKFLLLLLLLSKFSTSR